MIIIPTVDDGVRSIGGSAPIITTKIDGKTTKRLEAKRITHPQLLFAETQWRGEWWNAKEAVQLYRQPLKSRVGIGETSFRMKRNLSLNFDAANNLIDFPELGLEAKSFMKCDGSCSLNGVMSGCTEQVTALWGAVKELIVSNQLYDVEHEQIKLMIKSGNFPLKFLKQHAPWIHEIVTNIYRPSTIFSDAPNGIVDINFMGFVIRPLNTLDENFQLIGLTMGGRPRFKQNFATIEKNLHDALFDSQITFEKFLQNPAPFRFDRAQAAAKLHQRLVAEKMQEIDETTACYLLQKNCACQFPKFGSLNLEEQASLSQLG
jgi:hypothetical protein